MGLAMLSQGGSLTGFVFSFGNEIQETATASNIPIVDGKQIVNSTLTSGRYPNITVQVGTPVQWTIDVPEGTINGCNNRMLIRDYGIEYSFQTGENVIEFTPTKVGTNRYSCWMGMIRGTITVVEENAPVDVSAPESAGNDSIDSSSAPQEPIPAKVRIPTENLAIAEIGTMDVGEVKDYAIQRVSITLTDEGYSPAILVVEAGTDVEWTIHNEATDTKNFTMRVPLYSTILDLITGENQLYLFPTEDYAFSNGDNTFYGYVKVVDDLNAVDMDTIRSEVAAYQTLIYPEERFAGVNGSASCH
jgi:plastocyanin domain-containing protein